MNPDVVVIGAGIAGLSAARRLRGAGVNALVLEAGSRVGGRMTTDALDGHVIDRGAQFLSTGYPLILQLLRDLGLENEIRNIEPQGAIVRGGKLLRIRRQDARSALGSGLFSRADWLRYAWRGYKAARSTRHLPLNDYSAWEQWDTESAEDWGRSVFGQDFIDYLLEPAVQGFFFQRPKDISKILALVLTRLNLRWQYRLITLPAGIGTLPEAMARGLDIRLRTPVLKVRRRPGGVDLDLSGEVLRAGRAIVAATASTARRILEQPDALEENLISVSYSATIKISLIVSGRWRENGALGDLYSIWIPKPERGLLAAITMESLKYAGAPANEELVHLFIEGESSGQLMNLSDAEILRRVIPEAEPYLPGIGSRRRASHIVRWPEALPETPVGRSRAIAEYRRTWSASRRVLLCGDYMGMPFAEGAVESGYWAGDRLIHCLKAA